MAPTQPKRSGQKRPRKNESKSVLEDKGRLNTSIINPEGQSGTSSQDVDETETYRRRQRVPPVMLTPHTLRLLKLIQDGTAEHAEMAANQLHTITSSENNCRPVVLWEIMGRLQSFLVSPGWNTRRNAAVALEGVAQHLPVPDQDAFLEQTQTRQQQVSDNQYQSEGFEQVLVENWLTVQDVQTNLSTILSRGRQLLATTEEEYKSDALTEDEYIQTLTDQHMVGPDIDTTMAHDFCERRLEMQRRILARRLGLSDALIRYTSSGRDILSNELTQDDIVDPPQQQTSSASVSEKDKSRHFKKRRTTQKTVTTKERIKKGRKKGKKMSYEDDDNHDNTNRKLSIGELLVAQVYRQEKNYIINDEKSSIGVSHSSTSDECEPITSRNDAQHLLAGELVYRMFDADWHVRHGSLMGIRALIRAWNVKNHRHHGIQSFNDGLGSSQIHRPAAAKSKMSSSKSSFGCWPHDILARSLCVLALDRFGDFSGASTESTSTSMVAPIRESAAQVFSVVFMMAPESERQKSISVLRTLLDYEEWEVRHGALLAFKYVLVLMTSNDTSTRVEETDAFFRTVLPIAISSLSDWSDDIQSVAAHVFSICHKRMGHSEYLGQGVKAVWKSMSHIRLYSVVVSDLVRCLSDLIHDNSALVFRTVSSGGDMWQGCIEILDRLGGLISCEYISVKRSIVSTLGSVLKVFIGMLHSHTESEWSCTVRTNATIHCFQSLIERIFDLRLAHAIVDDTTSDIAEYFLFLKEIDDAWVALSQASMIVYADNRKERSALENRLLAKYFGLHGLNSSPQMTSSPFTSMELRAAMENARAITLFMLHNGRVVESSKEGIGYCTSSSENKPSENYDVLLFLLVASLESPLIYVCQLACFVIQSLCEYAHVQSEVTSLELETLLDHCSESLVRMQDNGALCLRGHSSPALIPAEVLQSLTRGIDSIQKGQSALKALTAVLGSWREYCPQRSRDDDPPVLISLDSMRLNTTISGTVITMGINRWPKKMSPLVRPLMTSIQNELDEENMTVSCMYFQVYFDSVKEVASSNDTNNAWHTASRVLKNLCDLVAAGEVPASTAASRVVGTIVGKIQSKKDLEEVKEVWGRITPIIETSRPVNQKVLLGGIRILNACCQYMPADKDVMTSLFQQFVPSLIKICCTEASDDIQALSRKTLGTMSLVDDWVVLDTSMVHVNPFLRNAADDNQRLRACLLLKALIDSTKHTASLCKAVRFLIPVVMPLLADSSRRCSEIAASIFSQLVVVAPLVETKRVEFSKQQEDGDSELVIDHLIHGKPLPPCDFHPEIARCLDMAGIVLRNYQQEGVSWLIFLQRVRLNGALCDSMGLGKTLQALLGVAQSHLNHYESKKCKSIIVCPSSLVGHWMNEVGRFFPDGRVFSPLALVGNPQQRDATWKSIGDKSNLVVTSYSVLRSDIDSLATTNWQYCVLDEGHLLRNPKTLTAKASRRIRSSHKLILTGTPIQNTVNEVWATFDFLMPNFLGTSSHFASDFVKPIMKGQKLDAPAADVAIGMEKLRLLHQQVLPFILRREKEHVLKELPPKIVTRIPCELSPIQKHLYAQFCSGDLAKKSLSIFQSLVESMGDISGQKDGKKSSSSVNPEILKTLLYLRLVCTHPWLVRGKEESDVALRDMKSVGLEMSGKLLALVTLLCEAGVVTSLLTAADNDSSLIYCDDIDGGSDDVNDDIHEVLEGEGGIDASLSTGIDSTITNSGSSRCLIFAQFTHSLDVVEELVLKRHMPSVKFLRLDGRVPASKRSDIVDLFNEDESFKILLLTTRIGGLGLNLTGADTVIFLEMDWNPFSDLQAADRAHRIGQTKSVRVYQLVTTDTIEEKTMKLHEKKLAMSSAIVNTDNSSMYSLGTDKLLDIFQYRCDGGVTSGGVPTTAGIESALDAMVERYQDEYQSLSLDDFLSGFQPTGGGKANSA